MSATFLIHTLRVNLEKKYLVICFGIRASESIVWNEESTDYFVLPQILMLSLASIPVDFNVFVTFLLC